MGPSLRRGFLIRWWIGQAIAPLLIVQRVANKSALTKDSLVAGGVSGFGARTREQSASDSGALGGGDPVDSVDRSGELRLRAGLETTADPHRADTACKAQ